MIPKAEGQGQRFEQHGIARLVVVEPPLLRLPGSQLRILLHQSVRFGIFVGEMMVTRHRHIKQVIVLGGTRNRGDQRQRVLALMLGRFQLFRHDHIRREIVDEGLGMSGSFNPVFCRLVRNVPIDKLAADQEYGPCPSSEHLAQLAA